MGPTDSQSVGNVPSATPQSAPASQGEGFNAAAVLEQVLGSNKTDLQALAVKAATPIAGGHVGQVPSSMLQPQQGYTTPTMDRREVVGAGNARAQGIGNSVNTVLSTISNVKIATDNKKKVEIASSTQQLLAAQQAADQAKQVMQANAPQSGQQPSDVYKQAKDAYDHNTQIQGTILTGKHGKDIMKGFNIDYTDPAANKTLQHDAVAMGKARAEAAAKFNAGTPAVMGPNVQAQAQYQAALEQRKEQLETVKAMGPIFSAQLKAQGALDVEHIRAAADLRKAAIDAGAKLDEQILKNKQADKDNAAAAALERSRESSARSLEALKQGNPIEVLKAFNEAQKNYGTSVTENQKSRQALNAELDKGPSSSRQVEIRRQLQSIDAIDEQAKNAFLLNRNVIAKGLGLKVDDARLQVPTVHVGEGAKNGTGSGNTATTGSNSGSSSDLDPRTGKPWKSSVSTADRLLIKGHYGAGIVSHDVEQTVDTINKGAKKIERFFDPDKPASD